MTTLCNDILELIGKEVDKIRNHQWWNDNYGYHLLPNQFMLDYKQLYKKDINSHHTTLVARKFLKFLSFKDSDLIPPFWPGILNYTLYNWNDICLERSYHYLPSKRCMRSNPVMVKKISKYLDF